MNYQPVNISQSSYQPKISLTKFIASLIFSSIIFIPIIIFFFSIGPLLFMAGDSSLNFFEVLFVLFVIFCTMIAPTTIYVWDILTLYHQYKPRPYSKQWSIYNTIMKIITAIVGIAFAIAIIFAILNSKISFPKL